MEAVSNTASICHSIFQYLVYAQKAREYEDEFERHQLRLDILQKRLSRQIEASRHKKNSSRYLVAQENGKLSSPLKIADKEERPLTEIIAAVQRTLVKAQQDAIKMRTILATGPQLGEQPAQDQTLAFFDKRRLQIIKAISRMQWAIYKRDCFNRSIADIAALVADLENLANNKESGS